MPPLPVSRLPWLSPAGGGGTCRRTLGEAGARRRQPERRSRGARGNGRSRSASTPAARGRTGLSRPPRGDLAYASRWLHECATETGGLILHQGRTVAAVASIGERAQLSFADGSREMADAVIGADG